MTSTEPQPRLTGSKIRQDFLDFFAERGHTVVPAASLVPKDDPTLLFTNSGMVQFKDVFLGVGTRDYTRAVDSQKCMRVAGKHNDLDDVGRDDSHHTFFEMLGNWSFGDYYKAKAIPWAWTLLTEVWGLPKDRLWATCFEDEQNVIPRDDEAADIWRQQPGFEAAHLLFFGRDENFWEMADTGPCGPDSEIHYDRGAEYCDMQGVAGHECRVNGECQRFLELWNLVFIQYNRTGPADLQPLPAMHVDTGMGLERIVSVLQNVDSNYKTDLFTPLLDRIQELAGHTEAERAAHLTPYRVIADHARGAAFLIADGVLPGNTGRNYVCRMIIRRASRFGSEAGFVDPFLADVARTVIAEYGDAYPELRHAADLIRQTMTEEERRFRRTVDHGVAQLTNLVAELKRQGAAELSGSVAFELYATFGLPLEIARDLVREHGLGVDEAGFHQAMEAHRLASGAGQALGEIDGESAGVYRQLLEDLQTNGLGPEGVEHNPYGPLEVEEPILAILREGERVNVAAPGDTVEIVMASTPFYLESGGQVSDTGAIASYKDERNNPEWEIRVTGVRRPALGLIVHVGEVVSGAPRQGDTAWGLVDDERRWDIMRNHTATHLLHSELRYVLGEHVRQAGSLVAPDRLRFDFTHHAMLTQDELAQISRSVNDAILANYPLHIEYKSHKDAVAEGAMALFGEKYGDTVRTIKIGEPTPFSYELCGGTHVPETADIGPFVITSESSVAAGVRRIEALTGRAALARIQEHLTVLNSAAAYLRTTPEGVARQVLALIEENSALNKQITRRQKDAARRQFKELLAGLQHVQGVPVLSAQVEVENSELLRDMSDWFRKQVQSGVMVLGANINNRPSLVAAVTKDLT
ncbi:MAG: alanine--tRNA ligase, partial [Anaerolineales bacterium]